MLRSLCLLTFLFLLGACARPDLYFEEDLADYDEEIARLQRQLIDEPGNAEALRELGVIYMRTKNYLEGNRYLEQAFARDADDPKTLFYLGLSNEVRGRFETALRLYDQEVPRFSPYRKLMRGRAANLRRIRARTEVLQLLAQEDTSAQTTSPRIVAVFPLSLQGGSERYGPLGRGISEMVMTDLANVNSLRLVERVRLQALLDELELAQSEYVDPATASRTGRLLQAGRLIGGNFAVTDDELAIDVAMVTSGDAASQALETTSGALAQLFDLEKQLVFRLLEEMEIELTPAERERIQRVPTQNLEAFLAYSRGLQEEDAGRFGAAATFYQQAAEIDPSFSAAAEQAEKASGMSATEGPPEQALAAAAEIEAPPEKEMDLIELRQSMMNGFVGGLFLPGETTRDPLQESVPLGEPPPPPER